MVTHSSTLAWKIPWMDEPDRLPSVGSHRVGHEWSGLAAAAAAETGVLKSWRIDSVLMFDIQWWKIRYGPCPPGAYILVAAAAAKSLQSCPTLCDPIDSSPPGSPVPGILQARTRLSDFTFTFHFYALEKEMATHSSVLPGESQGWRSLVGCCLWGRTESDTTEAI